MENESVRLLREILKWTKVGYFDRVKSMLERILDSEKKRLAYQAMDGTESIEVIKTRLQMGKSVVIDLYRKCENAGLMEQVDGKRNRLFDLADFDLLPPDTKQ